MPGSLVDIRPVKEAPELENTIQEFKYFQETLKYIEELQTIHKTTILKNMKTFIEKRRKVNNKKNSKTLVNHTKDKCAFKQLKGTCYNTIKQLYDYIVSINNKSN